MAFLIPLPTSLAYFDVLALLEGTTYNLRVRWNVRAQGAPAWTPSTLYGPGDLVSSAGNVYRFGAGVFALQGYSSLSNPPTGQGSTILDGAITWNYVRASGSWFMDLLDSTGTVQILSGLRLVASWPLGKANTGRMPPGLFVVQDTEGKGDDPGFDDLGARHRLIYFTSTELGL